MLRKQYAWQPTIVVLLIILIATIIMACSERPQAQQTRQAFILEEIRDEDGIGRAWLIQVRSRLFLVNREGGVIEVTY